MAYPNPVQPGPLVPPSGRPLTELGLLLEYPADEAESVALADYFPGGDMSVTTYPGAEVWVEGDCVIPAPGEGLAWDGGRILAWDGGAAVWVAEGCEPPVITTAGLAGRFQWLPGLSTVEFEWLSLWWFFWFHPAGTAVLSVDPPPPGIEWGADCPPGFVPTECPPPDCFVPWDAGRVVWDNGNAWWACDPP